MSSPPALFGLRCILRKQGLKHRIQHLSLPKYGSRYCCHADGALASALCFCPKRLQGGARSGSVAFIRT